MSYNAALLEQDLATYVPSELPALANTVAILLDTLDDGSTHYHVMRWRIESALELAIKSRFAAEAKEGPGGTIVPFPDKPE